MTREEFDRFCATLPAVTRVEQWGGASVWKIGGKIFAICSNWGPDTQDGVSFKCSDFSYTLLCEVDSVVPAPYLARAKWVQIRDPNALANDEIEDYIQAAYSIVAAKLTRAQRKALGIESK
ncbi:MmcQ/YjbR family DNA-binding protein [Hoeflea sp. WL0058]|uniref:MmcQ/YjbR family DNA-binding protein n=1 Tax=Flavimaribacter sediminis TaxID=2865987 RepID=A0AAE3D0K7_9HYPH|nr:MmcQ/YjbR family DNA-binding protein [Flavimaribacter sediminis]MBW8636861.1 MmcQ/YjbR family DNA-binding protein [Flavimaribacter sediminis]